MSALVLEVYQKSNGLWEWLLLRGNELLCHGLSRTEGQAKESAENARIAAVERLGGE